MKTIIKRAEWKSKRLFRDQELDQDYLNIATRVFWQSNDAFIDTDSKFLFKMVCAHFFADDNHKLELTLEGGVGSAFAEGYRLFVYNLIYIELTGEQIENNILNQEDKEALFYQVKLDAQMSEHQNRVLKIIQILDIDLKKESDRYHRVLFNTHKKIDFELKDAL